MFCIYPSFKYIDTTLKYIESHTHPGFIGLFEYLEGKSGGKIQFDFNVIGFLVPGRCFIKKHLHVIMFSFSAGFAIFNFNGNGIDNDDDIGRYRYEHTLITIYRWKRETLSNYML